MGNITLGQDEDEPEFSVFSWFAMLFAAGMGIGLVFWGAAEPLTFYSEAGAPPNAAGLADPDRAERALGQTFLHWGLHAWGIYVIVGLAVAYAVHRKGRPVSIRWALEPILGRRTDTWIGDVIDIIALVGTLFGIATSLGFGVNQIAAGLDHLGVLPNSTTVQVVIILAVTFLATLSAASGVDKGIKILSNLNMGLAAVLLITVLILGPTLFLLRDIVSNIGFYLQNFLQLSFQTLPFRGEEGGQLDQRLDHLLLGLVDLLVALRRRVHRAHLQGPHRPRVHRRRVAGPDRADLPVVHHHGRHGAVRVRHRGRRLQR